MQDSGPSGQSLESTTKTTTITADLFLGRRQWPASMASKAGCWTEPESGESDKERSIRQEAALVTDDKSNRLLL